MRFIFVGLEPVRSHTEKKHVSYCIMVNFPRKIKKIMGSEPEFYNFPLYNSLKSFLCIIGYDKKKLFF